MLETFTSGQDGETKAKFTLLPTTTKKWDKIYETFLKTLKIRQWTKVIPEKQKNEVSFDCTSLLPREDFQDTTQGGGNPGAT